MRWKRPRWLLSPRPSVIAAAMAATIGMLSVGLASPAAAYDPSAHTTFAGEPLPMGQANGTVFAVQVAGGKIFAGGKLTSTRPAGAAAGTDETGQAYLAAFDANTGEPVTGFAPKLENRYTGGPGTVWAMALSPDKSTLYVGGDFNFINGRNSEHIAKFDTATGNYLGEIGLNGVNGVVRTIAPSPDGKTLYVGGKFNKANWSDARTNLVGFDLATGNVTSWAPKTSVKVAGELSIEALAVSSDSQRVFLGGRFQYVNGVQQQGFAPTFASNSEIVPGFRSNYNVPGSVGYTQALAVKDGQLYLGGHTDGTEPNRNEGVDTVDEVTGARKWYSGCFGDTAAILPVNDDVYVASHTYLCEPSGLQVNPANPAYFAMHALNPQTGIMRPYWVQTQGTTAMPDTLDMSRALASDGNQLVMGGGFNSVNNKAQANIARFPTGSAAPSRKPWINGFACNGCTTIKLYLHAAADRDDLNLKYELYRNQEPDPIKTFNWDNPWPVYGETWQFDDVLPYGTKAYYRLKVTDSAGNSTWSVRSPVYTQGQDGTEPSWP